MPELILKIEANTQQLREALECLKSKVETSAAASPDTQGEVVLTKEVLKTVVPPGIVPFLLGAAIQWQKQHNAEAFDAQLERIRERLEAEKRSEVIMLRFNPDPHSDEDVSI